MGIRPSTLPSPHEPETPRPQVCSLPKQCRGRCVPLVFKGSRTQWHPSSPDYQWSHIQNSRCMSHSAPNHIHPHKPYPPIYPMRPGAVSSIVHGLLRLGASPLVRNNRNTSPLDLACSSLNPHDPLLLRLQDAERQHQARPLIATLNKYNT